MKAKYFLFSIFACASGFAITEVSVLGVLSQSTPDKYNFGVGAGIFFCAAGTLLSSASLWLLGGNRNIQKLALTAVAVGYITAGLLWLLNKQLSPFVLCYAAAIVYSAIYVIINFCLSASVYRLDQSTDRNEATKKMALPFFTAQAVIPIVSGWALDSIGLGAISVLLALAYSIPTIFILSLPQKNMAQNFSSRLCKKIQKTPVRGISITILIIAAISTLALNWYFSSTLTSVSSYNIQISTIGWVVSCINLAGIVGAGLIAMQKMKLRQQVKALLVSALLLCPGIMLLHSIYAPITSLTVAGFFIFAGLLAGIASALINSIKFKLFDETNYLSYHRLISMFTISSTLIGSLFGSLFAQKLGWATSMLVCIVICSLLSIKPCVSIFLNLRRVRGYEQI